MKVSMGMVNPIQISSTAHGHSSKVTLPVSRSESYYAHYKYVQGIPASSQQNSVPVKRLELLNNMIVSLQRLNKLSLESRDHLISQEITENGQAEADLQKIGSLIHEKLQEIPPSFAPADASAVTTGMAFDLQA